MHRILCIPRKLLETCRLRVRFCPAGIGRRLQRGGKQQKRRLAKSLTGHDCRDRHNSIGADYAESVHNSGYTSLWPNASLWPLTLSSTIIALNPSLRLLIVRGRLTITIHWESRLTDGLRTVMVLPLFCISSPPSHICFLVRLNGGSAAGPRAIVSKTPAA